MSEQKAREAGYLSGRLEREGDLARAEATIAQLKRDLADAMAALAKERELHEPIDLWPSKPMAVTGGFYHAWPEQGEHVFNKWQANTKTTQYRACIHPKCREVQYRDNPKG